MKGRLPHQIMNYIILHARLSNIVVLQARFTEEQTS